MQKCAYASVHVNVHDFSFPGCRHDKGIIFCLAVLLIQFLPRPNGEELGTLRKLGLRG